MKTKSKKDPRVDAYIENAPPYAQPILKHLRKVVHANCPQAEETIKWGKPWFLYMDKVLCGMVAFKAHCALIFNKGSLIVDDHGKRMPPLRRITVLSDLPSAKTLKSYIQQATKLNEPGAKKVKRTITKKPPVKTPPELMRALRTSPKALAAYKNLSASIQRHYVEWIIDAKTDVTRDKRLKSAVKSIAAGKSKHWE